jgi:hypothetical protein
MTMTIDANAQRFPLNLDHMSPYTASSQPQFTNPWSSTAAAPQPGSHGLYVGSQPGMNANPLGLDSLKHHQQQPQPPRTGPSSASMASFGSIPVTAASAGSSLSIPDTAFVGQQDLLSVPQDLLSLNRLPPQTTGAAYDAAYATSASPIHPTYATSQTPYDQLGYAPAPMRSTFAMAPEQDTRRYSHTSVPIFPKPIMDLYD